MDEMQATTTVYDGPTKVLLTVQENEGKTKFLQNFVTICLKTRAQGLCFV